MSEQQKRAVFTSGAPAVIGPYSQAVRVGNFVYTSGQVALDPVSGQLAPGGITEQTTQVFRNLEAVLTAAGTDFAHVVKAVVFLKDMNDFGAMNAVYGKYLAPPDVVPPARSTVEVARLPREALVEIELIASV
jgi:2-iminobutanoate/2-iminopropanoate deaminase